jgi:hypothetical protein
MGQTRTDESVASALGLLRAYAELEPRSARNLRSLHTDGSGHSAGDVSCLGFGHTGCRSAKPLSSPMKPSSRSMASSRRGFFASQDEHNWFWSPHP